MQTVEELSTTIPVSRACAALAVPRSRFYRTRKPPSGDTHPVRQPSPRALTPAERVTVRDTLNGERFQDKSPYQVYATLLDDEQKYLCNIRTMPHTANDNPYSEAQFKTMKYRPGLHELFLPGPAAHPGQR